jgi:hypothetical protein
MSQIHRRFTDEQVKVLFQGCCQGQFARIDLQELLAMDHEAGGTFVITRTTEQGRMPGL